MSNVITIYHGSQSIIEKPFFGGGKKHNDFGLGFYCTENEELAKEWAVSPSFDGYCNRYQIDTEYLNILYLNTPKYTILNWIAILVEHRLFEIKSPNARRAKQYLNEHFGINVNAFDIIVGYRADDSYFEFAEAFLNNAITVNQLGRAMKLGKLGEQIVIKSEYSFSLLEYQGYSIANKEEFFSKRKARDEIARQSYLEILSDEDTDGLYIQDIIRGGIGNEDPRIPRNIPS